MAANEARWLLLLILIFDFFFLLYQRALSSSPIARCHHFECCTV